MAHHHREPDHSHVEEKGSEDSKVHSSTTTTPAVNHSSYEVEKKTQDTPPQKKGKSFLDYQVAGLPWPFIVIMSLLAICVLGMVLKVLGVF